MSAGGGLGGGASQQQREAQRLERERAERAERERREAEERGALEALNEEQREEVNEAVSHDLRPLCPKTRLGEVIKPAVNPKHCHSGSRANTMLSQQFSLFDLDKDAHIDYHELKVALKALGFDLPKPEILQILQTHGIPASQLHNQPGSKAPQSSQPTFTGPSRLLLSQQSFQLVAAQRILARDPREEILRAFELFDSEGKGRIDIADLRRVARELGEGLQEEELQAMIEEFDVRGEGGVDRDTFLGICMG